MLLGAVAHQVSMAWLLVVNNIYRPMKRILFLSLTFFFAPDAKTQIFSTGDNHVMVICQDGLIRSWGINYLGELGTAPLSNTVRPVILKAFKNVASAVGGWGHTIAVKKDGTVWSWGWNDVGQLGDGTTIDHYSPAQVQGLPYIKNVFAGYSCSFALDSNSTLWAWGRNFSGQLGDSSRVDRFIPVKVKNLTKVVKVAISGHCLALKSDSTVWGWGNNSSGQIGIGPTNESNIVVPQQLTGLSKIVDVAVGENGYFSIALKADGTVWSWGINNFRQLGVDSIENSFHPVMIKGLKNVIAIATGGNHALALKSDGSVWAWGNNGVGQLGLGFESKFEFPTQIKALSACEAIYANSGTSFAKKNDNTFWSWGNDLYDFWADRSQNSLHAPGKVLDFCSLTVSIDEQSGAKLFLSPNPSQDGFFSIETDLPNVYSIGRVYNVLGNMISEFEFGQEKIRFYCPPGLYFLEMTSFSDKKTFKLISR